MIGWHVLAVVVGMMLVRVGWGGRRAVAAFGWALVAVASLLLAHAAGAWGLSVGTLAGMATALVTLPVREWAAPGRRRRADRDRAAATAPGPIGLARRVAVFLLVGPVGGVAALWLAFAAQAAARHAGMGPADASACLLFLPPILWCGLMTWQLTRAGPRRMIAPPLLAAVLGAMLWAAW